MGRFALRSWLHQHGLQALSAHLQRPRTTVPDLAAIVAEKRLLGQPAPTPPTGCGSGTSPICRWCYLATWPDTCPRRVVGWHLAEQMPTELVLLALEQALTLR